MLERRMENPAATKESPAIVLNGTAPRVDQVGAPAIAGAAEGAVNVEDVDPLETREWMESFEAVVRHGGRARGLFLLQQLEQQAQHLGIASHIAPYSTYRNTIALDEQAPHA
jgi:hypothetical protein